MPIVAGNLLEAPLPVLYQENELFQSLRDRSRISAGCQGCCHQAACRGGLKCLSYAVTGDPFQADPGCWLTNMENVAGGTKYRSVSDAINQV